MYYIYIYIILYGIQIYIYIYIYIYNSIEEGCGYNIGKKYNVI